MNPFERLAPFYDWEHADFLDDLPLYIGLAERVGGPILEVGCGSGRLAVPLARAGYETVGLDSSPSMLALANARRAAEPDVGVRLELRELDIRSAQLDRRFGLVVVGLDSFGLFLERDDQRRALRAIRRHLHANGLLVIDVANGNLRGGETVDETVLHRAGAGPRGLEVVKWVQRSTDHAQQVDRLLHLYDETAIDGSVRRTAVEVLLRYFTRFELELLLEGAGFFIEAVFGEYDLSLFGPESQRLIVIAHADGPGA